MGASDSLRFSLAIYSVLIAASSLFGGWLPGRVQLSHLRFQLLLSVIGGLLLGIGVFHLLVHAVHELGEHQIDRLAFWMMAGIVLMFFLLRAFHTHHHDPGLDVNSAEQLSEQIEGTDANTPEDGHCSERHCDHPHDAARIGGHVHDHGPISRLSWAGLFFGLSVHTLLDGLALGAAMQADAAHGTGEFVALGIFLGIVLHKPLDSLSITTMMLKAECSKRVRRLVNAIYALLCPLATTAFLLGVWSLDSGAQQIVGCSLAFSAGVFVCIALADLLPEMEFHTHHRWRLTVALLTGITLAWAIQFLEPTHLHH